MLNKPMKHLALRLLKALDAPSGGLVHSCIVEERWDDLVKLRFDPARCYETIDLARRDCLALEFLRKADFLETTVDKAQVARDAFFAAEAQCFRTNRHLERFFSTAYLGSAVDEAFFRLILKARAWIANTLGPTPPQLNGRFGPGATFEKEFWVYRTVTHYDKLRNTPLKTENLPDEVVEQHYDSTILGYLRPQGPRISYPTTRGNRFTTVPKDATKDRGIAIEPGINVFLQLAVGDALKTRLLRRGIDLRGTSGFADDVMYRLTGHADSLTRMGQHLHRRLAKEGSASGSLATIDLSSASDTICTALVELLLPEAWYRLLSDLRSPFTLISPSGKKKDRRWVRLEKFSSMGNGFTFELETLIFSSLLHAAGCKIGSDTYVYGDDIICPQELSKEVLAVLQYAGFSPNEKKTFISAGPGFRESCGGDFLFGHDIRPFYIKEEPHDPSTWITIANNLRSWSIKWSMPELMAVRNAALDNIPFEIRKCRGPEELGDLVIHDDEAKWNYSNRSSIRYFRVWRPVGKKLHLKSIRTVVKQAEIQDGGVTFPARQVRCSNFLETDIALVAAILKLPSDGLIPRNGVSGYRFGRVAYS